MHLCILHSYAGNKDFVIMMQLRCWLLHAELWRKEWDAHPALHRHNVSSVALVLVVLENDGHAVHDELLVSDLNFPIVHAAQSDPWNTED